MEPEHPSIADFIDYDPQTGKVRLDRENSQQLLFRVTKDGIAVWDKKNREEIIIPWLVATYILAKLMGEAA